MKIGAIKRACVVWVLAVFFFVCGCGKKAREAPIRAAAAGIDLETTIGSLAEIIEIDAVEVRGYGLVGGLRGTGSSECPTRIRAYLGQYILKQLPKEQINAEAIISSHDTAVVRVEGIMPAVVSGQQSFDVRVAALADTQTTSLEGGWLYGTELKEAGRFGMTMRVLARAKGPVFIDTIDGPAVEKRAGYVLGGGKTVTEYDISIALRQPDYRVASNIRNRLIERFGTDIASAVSAGLIKVEVPAKYKNRRQRFVEILKATYLSHTAEAAQERVKRFGKILSGSKDKDAAEISLEAIGNASFSEVAPLLNARNEEVRLRAGRCMLNLGSDRGLAALRQIAMDSNSAYRREALEAITLGARRNDATKILRRLLRDGDFDVRLATYESLRRLDDVVITRRLIGGTFYLEEVAQTKHKAIFVSRSGAPRIVLFGGPIKCRRNIFVRSNDGSITINAPAGQEYVSIMCKYRRRGDAVAKLKSSFEVSDIIRTLGEQPLNKTHPGLAAAYADTIGLLKQMCEKGVIEAEFRAGPLPKIGLNIKK